MTIFDTLNSPQFRSRPGQFIGKEDLFTLDVWIQGYIFACRDAGNKGQLETKNGIPILLLRDYIALQEQDCGVGGIEDILLKAAHGDGPKAWTKFFSYLDAFSDLMIRERWRMEITGAMTRFAEKQGRRCYTTNASGNIVPRSLRGCVLRKNVLTNGLCWIIEENPNRGSGDVWDHIWRSMECAYNILPEKRVDEELLNEFGEVPWEREP